VGFVTNTTPFGAIQPLNPLTLALASDISFLARGFAGDIEHLSQIMQMAIKHRGFAMVDILQPCVSFNRKNTFQWYRERVYRLDEDKEYDPSNKMMAIVKAQEWGDRIPIGLIYNQERPVFEKLLPALKKEPLVQQKIDPIQFEAAVEEFI
jgi:2-oxoglutarate ferredoxin oxidoreductase subunit beta